VSPKAKLGAPAVVPEMEGTETLGESQIGMHMFFSVLSSPSTAISLSMNKLKPTIKDSQIQGM
jgi:hypothetical protein